MILKKPREWNDNEGVVRDEVIMIAIHFFSSQIQINFQNVELNKLLINKIVSKYEQSHYILPN